MPLQLDNLTVVRDATMPKIVRGGGKRRRDPDANPIKPLLVESDLRRLSGGNAAMAIPGVPAEDVRELLNLIRYAAIDLDIGSRVALTSGDPNDDTPVTRLMLGKKDAGQEIITRDGGEHWTDTVHVTFAAAKKKESRCTHCRELISRDDEGIWTHDYTGETLCENGETTAQRRKTSGDTDDSDTDDAETGDAETVAEHEGTEDVATGESTPKPRRNRRKPAQL